ncbi:SAM-dependent methyltransferase [Acidobacteriota bacterium]
MDIVNPASFRDPDGFLFSRDGELLRQVNLSGKADYDSLIDLGLYHILADRGLLIPHREISVPFAQPESGYKIIQPEVVPLISYPYEWSFSQLKDAALRTLEIQDIALRYDMSLKDASAYNIQFLKGRPVFIDTLSFEKYREGEPWVAYRQFCQHFLAPLALMSYRDVRLGQLLRTYIDGIPLDLTVALLPRSAYFNMSVFLHIVLHGKSQKRYEGTIPQKSNRKVSRLGFQGILGSLKKAVQKLKWKPGGTEWDEYYRDTNYSPDSFAHKKKVVAEYIERVKPRAAWDLGANTGVFSRIVAGKGIPIAAFDSDPAAVEKNYLLIKEKKEEGVLPLSVDLTNPTPGTGWENRERLSLIERGPVDLVLALALIHHLSISNNVPLSKNATFFSRICHHLIIEFVPKEDSQVKRLLATREDVFPGYTQMEFEREFSRYFTIEASTTVKGSQRTLFLLKKKD